MLKYTIKRLLTFVPMMIAISLLSFTITLNSPGDPLENQIQMDNSGSVNPNNDNSKKHKAKKVKELGLDLPPFYISVTNSATSKELYKVYDKDERSNLKRLIHEYGNWNVISKYYKKLHEINLLNNDITYKNDITSDNRLIDISDSTHNILKQKLADDQISIRNSISKLLIKHETSVRKRNISKLDSLILYGSSSEQLEPLHDHLKKLKEYEKNLEKKQEKWKTYIPQIHFHGISNQYHQWFFGNGKDRKGIIRGDFGYSLKTGEKISTILWDRVGISFFLAIISMFIAYLVSIPLGIYSAYKKDSVNDRSISLVLFILYSMPSFFVGVILLLTFANADSTLYWFPESGISNPVTFNPDWKWYEWERIKHQAPYLILPIITYTYGSFAFLSRIMRIGMIDVLNQDYIRTARAKGLSERTVILKHALRNSLLPIITVFAAIFPASVGGSIVIEYIFSIPGMGMEIFKAIEGRDYPIIIAFFTIAGFLTMLGYLISDLLYAAVDPRISFK